MDAIKTKLKEALVKAWNLYDVMGGYRLEDGEVLFGEGSRFELDSLDYLTLCTVVLENFGVDMTLLAQRIPDPEKRIEAINNTIRTINSIAEYIRANS